MVEKIQVCLDPNKQMKDCQNDNRVKVVGKLFLADFLNVFVKDTLTLKITMPFQQIRE